MPDLMSDAGQQVKFGLTYICNEMAKDPYETFKLQILEQHLFAGPTSLFYKHIIEAGLAPAFCPGYGLDFTTRQATLTIGVQGVEEKNIYEIEKKITEALVEASKTGFDRQFFESVLHQLEFAAKKTS
jgi:Zn-dependent M16 (insulinase) family peptidase